MMRFIRFGRDHPAPGPEPRPRKDYSPLGEIGLSTPPPDTQAGDGATGGPGEPRTPGGGPRRPRRWRRRIAIALLLLIAVGAGLFTAVRRPPAAWRAYQHLVTQTTPQQRQQSIDSVLARLEASLQLDAEGSGIGLAPRKPGAPGSIDPDSPFADLSPEQIAAIPFDRTTSLTLTNEELAAFTVQWFETWVKQRGFEPPGEMRPPLIVAMGGKLQMAFEARQDGWSQVFGGEIQLLFREDGQAEGSVHRFTVGSMPVPLHQVGQVLSDDVGEETARKIGEWVRKLERFEFRPVLELEHRRRARVTDMQVNHDDTVTLTLRVQDHETYKRHNTQMAAGTVGPNGTLLPPGIAPGGPGETGIADVPATTD